jgi:transposase
MSHLQIVTDLLGLQGWQVLPHGIRIEDATVYVALQRQPGQGCQCARCGQQALPAYDHTQRQVRDFPLWGRRCFLRFEEARVECPTCGIATEKLHWLEPHQRQTVRYERYIARLCQLLPVLDVAELEGLDKGTVYRLDKKWLARRQAQRELRPVRYLGIDEIAIRKGHRYATVFYDLERREVIGLVKGRKERAVSGFFRRWGKALCRQVIAVCMDLWRPFLNSVRRHLTKAVVVFDKFHVFSYLSEALDEVRRQEQNQATQEGKSLLKGARWLLLKAQQRLRRKEKRALQELLELNQNLLLAHLLKEEFGEFYGSADAGTAQQFLQGWIERCQDSGLAPFVQLAKRIQRWSAGLLAYFEHPISNGISEGINNKIKVLKRRSYGFHDLGYFSLKILSSTGALPPLEALTHAL